MKRKMMGRKVMDKNTTLLLHFEDDIIDSSDNKIIMARIGGLLVPGVFGQGFRFRNITTNSYDNLSGTIKPLGTSDFTIDFWLYRYQSIAYQKFAETGNDYTSGMFNLDSSVTGSNLRFYCANTSVSMTSSITISNNAWIHVAIIRRGNMWNMFLGGVLVASITASANLLSTTLNIHPIDCIVDEFRISNVARWTSNFTPPTKPY